MYLIPLVAQESCVPRIDKEEIDVSSDKFPKSISLAKAVVIDVSNNTPKKIKQRIKILSFLIHNPSFPFFFNI